MKIFIRSQLRIFQPNHVNFPRSSEKTLENMKTFFVFQVFCFTFGATKYLPNSEKKMEIKEKIYENSIELFMVKGCKAVTMDDIAKANGISKRTLYELFKDKSQLLEESIIYKATNMINKADKLLKESESFLDIVFLAYDKQSNVMMNNNMIFVQDMKRYYYDIYKSIYSKIIERHRAMILESLIKGEKEGMIISGLDKKLVAMVFLEIGATMDKFFHSPEKDYSRREIFKTMIMYYLRGISTPLGIKKIDNYLQTKENEEI